MTSVNDPGRRPDEKESEGMSKLRISLLGLVAVYLVSMFTAVVASAAGPFWHTNGAKLKQGSVGVKLQNKGTLSLTMESHGLRIAVICGRSTSDSTIDGQGETKQGQGKGVIKFEQCETRATEGVGSCTRPETITTNQLKAHLAESLVQGKTQIVELFESGPQQVEKPILFNIPFNICSGTLSILAGVTLSVKGSVAGTISPQEMEGQGSSLSFPAVPITKVNHEEQQVIVGLTAEERPMTLIGFYGVRVQSGTFGAFRQ